MDFRFRIQLIIRSYLDLFARILRAPTAYYQVLGIILSSTNLKFDFTKASGNLVGQSPSSVISKPSSVISKGNYFSNAAAAPKMYHHTRFHGEQQ
jgi:hypothetical protein